jgi:hypothetical protein
MFFPPYGGSHHTAPSRCLEGARERRDFGRTRRQGGSTAPAPARGISPDGIAALRAAIEGGLGTGPSGGTHIYLPENQRGGPALNDDEPDTGEG